MNNEKNSTAKAIEDALEQMLSEGAKINVSAVARRAGTTHTNIWKHYPHLYQKITDVKNELKEAKEESNRQLTIDRLKKKIVRLEEQIKDKDEVQQKDIDAIIMAKLTELYRDYDYQLRKNIDLANINLHGGRNIDTDTGEVIDAAFGKGNE
ncbi:hypothetical protein [Photobacterium chitinilyticum]|uniref:Uncharacterized protein n=1 Tax=Photobacterium chitinilyticum TaxID=2485123 RepID=A0A444JW72_9GAMM|nr:hypothetical protein [Photobacterium chitinilyticum]RWX57320.1 hypothetical protein EDI28_04630 [Photobacterium chitinilyticum]